MKSDTTIEFWKRLCSTPTGLKAVQKSLAAQHRTALALRAVKAQSAAALLASKAASSERPIAQPLFGLARTAAAWNAQLTKSAPRPSTESVWAKQFPAKEVTGLARTIAAFKRAA